jgi:hypothetical protein
MKLEEALQEVRKRPDVPIRELWSELLRDAWQDELLTVQHTLDRIEFGDLAAHAFFFDHQRFQDAFEVLNPDFKTIGLDQISKFQKKLKATIGKDKFELIEKVNSVAADRGLPILDYLIEARASANLASQLQKNATKQGLYEPIAAAYIWHRTQIKPALLSHTGSQLQVRFNSEGKAEMNKKAHNSLTKSADILCVFKSGSKYVAYLASHKYARVGGGHQMNQRADAAKYLSYSGKAAQAHEDIPNLLSVCEKLLGVKISPENLTWEPCLILDGEFFENAPKAIRLDPNYPELETSPYFVGDTQGFVDFLESKRGK